MSATATTDQLISTDSLAGGASAAELCLRESMLIGVLCVSQHGEIIGANRQLARLLGLGSPDLLIGRTLSGDLLVDGADWQAWRSAYTVGRESFTALRLRREDGTTLTLAGEAVRVPGRDGKTRVLFGSFVDVTRQRQLEAAVHRGARMEALASLTSGIAHDVNNLLTVLVGNLYLVGEELRDKSPLFEKIKPARDAAKRGAALTRQLLSFARREAAAAELIRPARLVGDLAPLLQQVMGKRITLSLKVADDAGPVLASAAQLESVIVNLAINARDAIEREGVITISLGNRELAAGEAESLKLRPGQYTLISLADDGAGIADELKARIFEPFFTTKQSRGGTGLGLSMVRWFAEEAGGGVHVASRPGAGTTITLVLPRSSEGLGDTGVKTMPLSTLPTGTEKVVVLASDEALCATIRETLQVLGYQVSLSRGQADLFDVLQRVAADVVIIDAGAEAKSALGALLRRARALRPDAKLILTTTDRRDAGVPTGGAAPVLIMKPFSLAEFAATVRRTLDGVENV
jgi:PAS domain S-box-containing protein